MKYPTISLLTLFFVACSTPNKKENKQIEASTVEIKPGLQTNKATDPQWLTYTDAMDNFVVSYKYSKTYISEHMENADCIGKPIKNPDAFGFESGWID